MDLISRTTAQSAITPAVATTADAMEAALADMTRSFSDDFGAGQIEMQHNRFEHRSRVLRQLTVELAAARAQEADRRR